MEQIILSKLGHTWILDLDGTIVKHNGYKDDGHDTFLPGALEFLRNISDEDMIVFITSRKLEYQNLTESFLQENGVRYDHIIFEAPYGERILLNDDKPSGLKMGKAVNLQRDSFPQMDIVVDEEL
ncbi:hypothetical protein SAMN04487928_1415 [Butyrivibrio proteoclasticus]|uniref:FCP1 homology domain-containing protein n=1 Tax=Butyrivibrio proteoclasticus TaxID=43305 RepID=A0A1I5Y5V2_9FIRM|nr:hypothetical protein [Butyrivibrio proteoclasticus]SFQ39559.1 hypothetical protein SAMN04487928_1415 [Butyrivibrio proteoclasticus]